MTCSSSARPANGSLALEFLGRCTSCCNWVATTANHSFDAVWRLVQADATSLVELMKNSPFRQLGDAGLLLPEGTNATCHCNGTTPAAEGGFMPPFSREWWMYGGAALGCITVAALA